MNLGLGTGCGGLNGTMRFAIYISGGILALKRERFEKDSKHTLDTNETKLVKAELTAFSRRSISRRSLVELGTF